MDTLKYILIAILVLLTGIVITGIPVLGVYLIYLKIKDKSRNFKELFNFVFKKKIRILSILIISFVLFSAICLFFFIFLIGSGGAASRSPAGESEPTGIERLVRGRIGYYIPDTMKVGNQYKAIVSITKALNDSILFLNLDSSDFKSEEIKVSSKVNVTLLDPTYHKNFDIINLNSNEQFVGVTTNTIWRWNIIPLRSGNNSLILTATVKIISDLGETSKDIPVFEKQIIVKASPMLTVQTFFTNNWQWIAGTILIPVLIWRYKVRKGKKKADTTNPIKD